jgi:type I restriction enzyme M protein
MSEELRQKGLLEHGLIIGHYEYYNIGATNLNQLKKAEIIPEKDYGDYGKRKPDALLVDRRNKSKIKVIAVIEYKDIEKFSTSQDKKKTSEQCNDVSQVLDADIGISTDGNSYVWINPKHPDKNNEYVDKTIKKKRMYSIIKESNEKAFEREFVIDQKENQPDVNKLKQKTMMSLNSIEELLNILTKSNSDLHNEFELEQDPTDLAKQIWQDVWSITRKDPEKCLYTFLELFIFKYLSDLDILSKDEKGNKINFKDIIKLDPKEAFKNYFANVRPYLESMFPADLNGDGTTVINGNVLNPNLSSHSAVFFKILKKFENFGEIRKIKPSFKSQVFEAFMKESVSTKFWGRYFTPRNIVDAMIEISGIENLSANSKICDPACGVGGFILEPIRVKNDVSFYFKVKGNDIWSRHKFFGYDIGFEKDEQLTIILAKANMLIFLSEELKKNPSLSEKFSELFNSTFKLYKNSILGTLGKLEENEYDLILTNPPYLSSGSSNVKDEIKKNEQLKTFYKTNGQGLESLFIEWIIQSLKPGKKAFVVIPHGILDRTNDAKVRQFIRDECILDAIISLPVNSFYTTPKKTLIIALTKKDYETSVERKQNVQIEPVFTYLIKDIGESLDIYRSNFNEKTGDKIPNDLIDMVSQFNQFKGTKNTFETADPKCKIQSIDRFNASSEWTVDRWWTKQEKVDLKIETQINDITKEDFLEFMKQKKNEIELTFNHTSKLLSKKLKEISEDIVEYKEFALKDELFTISRGSPFYTKKKILANGWTGNIPVYSSKTEDDGLMIKIDKQYLQSEDDLYYQHCLTWATDGYAGTLYVRNEKNIKNEKRDEFYFTLTDHCGILLPKKKELYLPFIKYVLQPLFYDITKGYGKEELKVGRLDDLKIKLPVTSSGIISMKKQKELAELYQLIEKSKDEMEQQLSSISEQRVTLV